MAKRERHYGPELVPCPALGLAEVPVNFCRNPVCSNFGKDVSLYRDQYRVHALQGQFFVPDLKFTCKQCGGSGHIYSPQAVVREITRCVRNLLPYSACRKKSCENHTKNLFEHYEDHKTYTKKDWKQGKRRFKCKKCEGVTTIGKSLGTHVNLRKRDRTGWFYQRAKTQEAMLERMSLLARLLVNGIGQKGTQRSLQIHPSAYDTHRHSIANACENFAQYHVWRHFLGPGAERIEELRLCSDILEVSIKRTYGGSAKFYKMGVVCTVVDYGDLDDEDSDDGTSNFLLAVTPCYTPLSEDAFDSVNERFKDANNMGEFRCNLDCANLKFGGLHARAKPSKGQAKTETYTPENLPSGCFVHSTYASLGHFFTLAYLLRDVGRVVHYLDNESVLRIACTTAFASRIKPTGEGEPTCGGVLARSSQAPFQRGAR